MKGTERNSPNVGLINGDDNNDEEPEETGRKKSITLQGCQFQRLQL